MNSSEVKNHRANDAAYTVSQIALAVKQTVEANFDRVQVRGEVSNYRGPHSSGHVYFALKDEKSRLEAVIWRGVFSKLRFKPEEGMEVLATGKLTTYPGSSKYQIVIEQLEPAGIGALMALLEERRKKLAAEGLFDQTRKQSLPFLPKRIGVITSPTGAVIRDILHRLKDRCPTHVLVWPVRVQGETSADEVTSAIVGFNKIEDRPLSKPDLIIIARGGGSLEDLWSFNEESVVRAAAASKIPIISAIGHETDWTLLDLVADVRAPTPTGAAEMAVPVRHELETALTNSHLRSFQAILRYLDRQRTALKGLTRALPQLEGLLALPQQRFDMAARRLPSALKANSTTHRARLVSISSPIRSRMLLSKLSHDKIRFHERLDRFNQAITNHVTRMRERLTAQSHALQLVSYQSVIARGFALVRDLQGTPIRQARQTKPRKTLILEFSDGQVKTIVQEQEKAITPKRRKQASSAKPKYKVPVPPRQGDLF